MKRKNMPCGECSCESCCITEDQLPTSITLTCDGIDYLLTMGAWTNTSTCCWIAESNPISVPGLTYIDDHFVFQSYYSAESMRQKIAIIDRLAFNIVSWCGETPAVPNPRPVWYEREYLSEYLHEVGLRYRCMEMNVQVSIAHKPADCGDGEKCQWQIQAIFVGRNTTGATKNFTAITSKFEGSSTKTWHFMNSSVAACVSEPGDPQPVKYDWSADNRDTTNDPPPDGPTSELTFSRGKVIDLEDRPTEVEFNAGDTFACSPNCNGVPDDQEGFITIDPQPANSGYVTWNGAIFSGTPPADILTDPGMPSPWPTESGKMIDLGGGNYEICNLFPPNTYITNSRPNPCEVGVTTLRYATIGAGGASWTSYRKNELIGPNYYNIVRPSFKLKFTWP